jgi:hypothetical protein
LSESAPPQTRDLGGGRPKAGGSLGRPEGPDSLLSDNPHKVDAIGRRPHFRHSTDA